MKVVVPDEAVVSGLRELLKASKSVYGSMRAALVSAAPAIVAANECLTPTTDVDSAIRCASWRTVDVTSEKIAGHGPWRVVWSRGVRL